VKGEALRSDETTRLGGDAGVLRAVFMSNACTAAAFAILTPALVANLAKDHASAFGIAVVTSIWALPSVFGGPLFTRVIARFNARTVLLAGMSSYVLIILAFPALPNIWAWITLQLISGVLLGFFYLVIEAWLNHLSTDSFRGRVAAIYGIVPAIGYSIGAGVYALVGCRGYAPFIAAAIAAGAGMVPLLGVPTNTGEVAIGGEMRLWASARAAPFLLAVGAVGGMLQTVAWGDFPVYALSNGFSVRNVSSILSAFFAGQIVLTYPIGWLGDRFDRRVLLTWIGWMTVAIMTAMVLGARAYALWPIAFVAGGLFCAVYTLGLAVLGQRFESRSLASACASFMSAYSMGAVLGPPLVGGLMDRFGPVALPLSLAGAGAALSICGTTARLERTSRRTV
jgi:MFS family permease